jgi:IclR family pca regulon transcriptional regulator
MSKATQLLDADDDREPTIAEQIDAMTDPSFMTSLARGLAVLRAFSDARKPQTIASISQKTGIPRAPCAAACTPCASWATSMRS